MSRVTTFDIETAGIPDSEGKVGDKDALSPLKGRIICIAYKFNDNETQAVYDDDEAALLAGFFDDLNKHPSILVGYNIIGFDIPFVLFRSLALGVRASHVIPRDLKPWSKEVFDCMKMLPSVGNKFLKLGDVCESMALDNPKDAVSGSGVGELYKEGRLDEIVEYCKKDVDSTYELYKKMKLGGF